MAESRNHCVLQFARLKLNGALDSWVRMAKKINPLRADGIYIAVAVEVFLPNTTSAPDRHERQGFFILHLCAGMADDIQVTA